MDLWAPLKRVFCGIIVRAMTDSVIDALTTHFEQQQGAIDALGDAVRQREESVAALNAAWQASQDGLADLAKKLQSDAALPTLAETVSAGNKQLDKLTATLHK